MVFVLLVTFPLSGKFAGRTVGSPVFPRTGTFLLAFVSSVWSFFSAARVSMHHHLFRDSLLTVVFFHDSFGRLVPWDRHPEVHLHIRSLVLKSSF